MTFIGGLKDFLTQQLLLQLRNEIQYILKSSLDMSASVFPTHFRDQTSGVGLNNLIHDKVLNKD